MENDPNLEVILSILPELDIRPLVKRSWVNDAIALVSLGKLPKTELEQAFLRLAVEHFDAQMLTERLEEENAHLSALCGAIADSN